MEITSKSVVSTPAVVESIVGIVAHSAVHHIGSSIHLHHAVVHLVVAHLHLCRPVAVHVAAHLHLHHSVVHLVVAHLDLSLSSHDVSHACAEVAVR